MSSMSMDLQGALNASRDAALAQAKVAAGSKQDVRIEAAAQDFESILLGSWLQKAEASFGSVPGGDDQGDDDSGKEQYEGIAMQAMAGSLAASGGIGIARMIADHLRRAAHAPSQQAQIAAEGPPEAKR